MRVRRGPLIKVKVIGTMNISMGNPKIFQNNVFYLKLLHIFHIQCHCWALQDAGKRALQSLNNRFVERIFSISATIPQLLIFAFLAWMVQQA